MPVEIRGMVPLVQVFDMPASLKFYVDLLGFQIIQQAPEGDEPDWVWLRLLDAELMLNTAYEKPERPARPDAIRINHHRDTALYFGCPDVEKMYDYLRSAGADVKKPYITGYGWKAIDLEDPDGYHLCFQWPFSG